VGSRGIATEGKGWIDDLQQLIGVFLRNLRGVFKTALAQKGKPKKETLTICSMMGILIFIIIIFLSKAPEKKSVTFPPGA
jgi:hypothetical protein